jgi:hypothetical protein
MAMRRQGPKTKRNAPTISGAELKQALATLKMTADAFAARGGWHRSIIYKWLAAKYVPPHVAWIIALLLERRQLSEQLSGPAQ